MSTGTVYGTPRNPQNATHPVETHPSEGLPRHAARHFGFLCAREDSDVDILIDFEPDFRFGLVTFCNIENQISETLGKKVDLVMKRALKPRIGKRILQEVIYL